MHLFFFSLFLIRLLYCLYGMFLHVVKSCKNALYIPQGYSLIWYHFCKLYNYVYRQDSQERDQILAVAVTIAHFGCAKARSRYMGSDTWTVTEFLDKKMREKSLNISFSYDQNYVGSVVFSYVRIHHSEILPCWKVFLYNQHGTYQSKWHYQIHKLAQTDSESIGSWHYTKLWRKHFGPKGLLAFELLKPCKWETITAATNSEYFT